MLPRWLAKNKRKILSVISALVIGGLIGYAVAGYLITGYWPGESPERPRHRWSAGQRRIPDCRAPAQ